MACEVSTGKTVRRIRAQPGIEAFPTAGHFRFTHGRQKLARFLRRRRPTCPATQKAIFSARTSHTLMSAVGTFRAWCDVGVESAFGGSHRRQKCELFNRLAFDLRVMAHNIALYDRGKLVRVIKWNLSAVATFLSMPRYFFNVYHDCTQLDYEGEELPENMPLGMKRR